MQMDIIRFIGVGCYKAFALYLGISWLGQTYQGIKSGHVERCNNKHPAACSDPTPVTGERAVSNVAIGVSLVAAGLFLPSELIWAEDLLAKKTERKDALS